jgi:putative transposase
MDNKKLGKYDLNKYGAVRARDSPMLTNSTQWLDLPAQNEPGSSISRFYDNCKQGNPGKKGYLQFQKNCRSVEYKSSGWKLASDPKSINLTD